MPGDNQDSSATEFAAGLEAQALEESAEEDRQGESKESEPSDDGKGEGVAPKSQSSSPSEGEQEPEEEGQAIADDGDKGKKKDPKPEVKPESGKDPKTPATLKIGKQEFATPESLAKEATRIMGHNAQLAGDLNRANETISERDNRIKELEDHNSKLADANKRWKEWYDSDDNTKRAPGMSPDEIAEATARRLKAEEAERSADTELEKEVEHLESLENYEEVYELIEKLASKINPETDKEFTPREAYEYACRKQGLEDLWNGKKEEPPKEEPKPETVETPPDGKNPIKSSAARPSGSGSASMPKSKEKSFEDEYFEQNMPFGA